MKQKIFTFKYFKNEQHDKGAFPLDALTHKDSLKNRMIKKGYLVKNLKETEMVVVTCILAKANVSLKEREKMQSEIDNNDLSLTSE